MTPYAEKVMNLQCNFCHQGHDPREEAPIPPVAGDAGFTLRKVVNPEETCLLCHGTHPYELMELPGPWPENRQDFEFEDGDNGCLACHGEGGFRTVRHQVNYLNAEGIEEAALENADVCYGCHGGRAWYRIPFPYARHPWPDMPEETPDWAKDRPTESAPRFLTGVQMSAGRRRSHPDGEGLMQGKALGFLEKALNVSRRGFIKGSAAGAATGLVGLQPAKEAKAFAYEPYPTDDELTTVVTSCAHNCGSRHMLVAHKKGDVIVRLSTDDGSYQGDGLWQRHRGGAAGARLPARPLVSLRASTRRSACSIR